MYLRSTIALTILIALWTAPATALQVIEKNKIYIYFPPNESSIADKLLNSTDSILAYLKNRGLSVSLPQHIVLDNRIDQPEVRTYIIPHREIRIPLRAPGVLENGYTESDPWQYFLFMGLASQAIYNQRARIPNVVHWVFGELISPNVILPDWTIDGISFLLYEEFTNKKVALPFLRCIFDTTPIPPLDQVSNHPDLWPGRDMYRIFGRPFVRWLYERYGWDKLLSILRLHSSGILPVEIDREARKTYGASWDTLWRQFQHEFSIPEKKQQDGVPVAGYWPSPFVYWNDSGFFPGPEIRGRRGRYGYLADNGYLWFSEYQAHGISSLGVMHDGNIHYTAFHHYWDPGPGRVAVTRKGSRPFLSFLPAVHTTQKSQKTGTVGEAPSLIAAPPGVIQLSGPVMNSKGQVAVAANKDGNWDIWIYDHNWRRITNSNSIELDPWFDDEHLLFSSDVSGCFQIHTIGMRQLTHESTSAMLPRDRHFMRLDQTGWILEDLGSAVIASGPVTGMPSMGTAGKGEPETASGKHYTIWSSLKTNYLIPDIYIDTQDAQFGLATTARDITDRFGWDAGFRYSPRFDTYSWRLGAFAEDFSARITRYPFSYSTDRVIVVNELRYDFKLAWSPAAFKGLELSGNYRRYWPARLGNTAFDEWWAAAALSKNIGDLHSKVNLDLFANNSMSFMGDFQFQHEAYITTALRLQIGKTWGDWIPGHNSFRIGGNTSEGIFTRRSTRLFPVRGFDPDVLDSDQAFAAGIELQWPLANLQAGYKTLPVFIRHIVLVTFFDSGMAASQIRSDELLLSAGFELVTDLELAWIFNTELRVGMAWPLVHPEDVRQSDPMFLIQIGYPL